jgi:hypothetical protein
MNDQWDAVAEMLGIKENEFSGGVEYCELSVEQLSGLLDMGFIVPEFKFNNSPTIKTFFEFGKRAEACGAAVAYIGFLESKSRKNAQLVIDGIVVIDFNDLPSLILDFSQTFHNADEFTANSELLRAWYD